MTEEEALTTLKGDDPTLAATAEARLWSLWWRSAKSEAEKLLRAGVEAMQRRKLDEAGAVKRIKMALTFESANTRFQEKLADLQARVPKKKKSSNPFVIK